MKVLLQRVQQASITIDKVSFSNITKGMLLFVGICKDDNKSSIEKAVKKIIQLRIFPDENGRMNKNISEVNGQILVVSQFTLCAKIKSGSRPSFSNAMNPSQAEKYYEMFIQELEKHIPVIKTGKFGAYMKVNLINDGPVTFMLEF